MRLFVALDIDPEIQQRLHEYVRLLAPRFPGVRFVRSDNFHVTLKFLGELPEAGEVIERLRSIRQPEVALTVRGVGFFPNARAPRVFWAGIESPTLAGLAGAVSVALKPMGFAREESFRPHLTLARNGSGRPHPAPGERSPAAMAKLARIVTTAAAPEFGTMSARQFYLYESRLSPNGSSYIKLLEFVLGD
jgi:2'-5' RNA ligase